MNTLLPVDEINALKVRLRVHFDERGRIASRRDCEAIIDEMLDLFLLACAGAVDAVNRQFGADIHPSAAEIEALVYQRIDGATWRDRVLMWYQEGGTAEDIDRIVETEAHRIANAAAYETAVKAGATMKTWVTMGDEKVRDTHQYLDGVTVPIDGYFYSYMGGQTLFPGQWGIAEEDCNCRCWTTFS